MNHRGSIRIKNHNYTQPKSYFITICANQHASMFGDVVNGQTKLNKYGQIAQKFWTEIPQHFSHVKLDEFVVMPNHMHGIVVVGDYVGARHAAPLHEHFGRPIPGNIPTIIRSFKSAVTKRVREMSQMPNRVIWQRNYYERVVRSNELDKTRQYIINNPSKWNHDLENIRIGSEYASLS